MSRNGRLAMVFVLGLSGLCDGQPRVPATPAATTATAAPAPAVPVTPVPAVLLQPQPAVQVPPAPAPVFGELPNWSSMPPNAQQPANVPARPAAGGQVIAPAGPQAIRIGGPPPAAPVGPPPPRSVEAGPAGTYKMQSLSGERIYLTGGLRVKLAGVVIPGGEPGTRARTALRELLRTLSLRVEKAHGSPPLGDANAKVWLWLPDNRNVTTELLRQGAVQLDVTTRFRSATERDIMITAQEQARAAGLGIWAR